MPRMEMVAMTQMALPMMQMIRQRMEIAAMIRLQTKTLRMPQATVLIIPITLLLTQAMMALTVR